MDGVSLGKFVDALEHMLDTGRQLEPPAQCN